MNKKQIRKLIEASELLTDLTATQRGDLEMLVQSKGFQVYVGLLLGARQAQLVTLSNTRLGNPELSCAASVIQGIVKGLDLAVESFVDLFPEAGDGE